MNAPFLFFWIAPVFRPSGTSRSTNFIPARLMKLNANRPRNLLRLVSSDETQPRSTIYFAVMTT